MSPYQRVLEQIDTLNRKGKQDLFNVELVLRFMWNDKGVVNLGGIPFVNELESIFSETAPGVESYNGDVLGAYLVALVTAIQVGGGSVWAKNLADKVADVVLKTQIPWDGKYVTANYNTIYVPQEAGGFMGLYNLDE